MFVLRFIILQRLKKGRRVWGFGFQKTLQLRHRAQGSGFFVRKLVVCLGCGLNMPHTASYCGVCGWFGIHGFGGPSHPTPSP